jgi:hypothetical protein
MTYRYVGGKWIGYCWQCEKLFPAKNVILITNGKREYLDNKFEYYKDKEFRGVCVACHSGVSRKEEIKMLKSRKLNWFIVDGVLVW